MSSSLTVLSTNHPWGKGIQVSSNEGDNSSPRGDNSERKNTLKNFKNLFQNQQDKINQT
jgi:hypothetical protein